MIKVTRDQFKRNYFLALFFILGLSFFGINNVYANDCFLNTEKHFQYGDIHEDVRQLQKYLNSKGFILSNLGPGSVGKETNYFGSLTRQALIKFQDANKLAKTGILDFETRKEINNLNKKIDDINEKKPITEEELIITEREPVVSSSKDDNLEYYFVGGQVTGLISDVVIKNNNKDEIIVRPTDSGKFVFPTKLLSGKYFNVSVQSSYQYQTCYLKNNIGFIDKINIENIIVECRPIYSSIGSGGSSSRSSVRGPYILNYLANSNGSLTGTSSQTVDYNTSGTSVTATPDVGYHFSSWSDGVLTATRTDENVVANLSVTANFSINTYIINSSSGSGGTITPLGETSKDYNSSQSYQIEANDGYQIENVLVDGVSVGAVDIYQFSNINHSHTVEASFETIPISVVFVSSISPSSAYDTKSITIDSIVGTGFRPGVSVKLTRANEEDINCTSIIFESSTLISNALCNITSKEAGDWNVVVVNNDTGTGELENGFEVKEYEVGDLGPLGGYIFYVNENYESDGWKYMEAAPTDQDLGGIFTKKWWSNTSNLIGGTGTGIGAGLANTSAIVNGSSPDSNSSVGLAYNYSLNGYMDWFLPSRDELSLMYTNLHLAGLGGFENTGYWSSSEVDDTNAIRRTFSGVPNNPEAKPKINTYRTRAVRRFTTCPTYSISYNGNGNTSGEAPIDNSTYLTGSNVTVLNQNTLEKSGGYSFEGWNTAPDGSGTNYAIGATLAMPANDIVLYAKWSIPNYTIAILPDTQSYVNWKPAEMTSQINWLVNNKEDLNLKFVAHVGDVVQNWANDLEGWEFVQTEMQKLKTASISYSVLPGNHDYAYMTRDSSVFNTYFPLSNFEDMDSYGGSYDENSDNHYHIFTVDKDGDEDPDDKILILSLEFGPRAEVVAWANQILENSSTTPAIVITHAYLQPDGDLLEHGDNHAASNGYGLGADVYDGDELWTSLIEPNDNVRFVFSGHDGESNDGSALRTSYHQNDPNKPVYQVMANYQYYPVNEAGYLVLLNFTENQVTMKSYSPWTSTYKTDAESQATFGWAPFGFE